MKLCRLTAAIMAVVLMICALPVFAEIEYNYTAMYVSKTTMPVYKKASASSKQIGTFSYGDIIFVVQYNSSWAQITNAEGDIGYCRTSYLMKEGLSDKYTIYYADTNDVQVYAKASTASAVIGALHYDDNVYSNAVTPDGKFLRVEYDGGHAFVEKAFFSPNPSSEAQSVYIKKTTATLRRGRSNSYAKTGTAYFGEEFSRTRQDSGWSYISNDYVSGWVQDTEISSGSVIDQHTVYSAISGNVNVYGRNGKMLAELDRLSYGEEVVVIAFTPDSVYAMVEFGDVYGYVKSASLRYVGGYDTEEPDDDDGFDDDPVDSDVQLVYVIENNVIAYKAPSAAAKKAGTVSYGEVLTCRQISGDWVLIENSVGQGWIPRAAVDTKDPCSSSLTVYVSASRATVYQRPVTSANVLGTIQLNSEVVMVGMTPDKLWCRVKYNDGYGFVAASELSKTHSAGAAESITVYVTVNNATAYKQPAEIAAKAGTVSYGEVLTCIQVSGEWALIKNSAGQGWVRKNMLSTKNPCSSSLTGYVSVNTANVHQRPGASSKVLGTLSLNEEVTVVGRTPDKSWYRIMYDGGYGFVKVTNLTGKKPTETGTKVYVRYNAVDAYATSSSSSNVVAEVYYGQELIRLSTQNGWSQVTNGKTQAWIKSDALTTYDPNIYNTALYVKGSTANIINKPVSSGSKTLATFNMGDVVIGVAMVPGNEWVRIKYNGGYAYMAVRDLTTESPFEYEDKNAGSSGNEDIERIIALAVAQYGKPYVYAEEGPNSYDCSGLVQYCFLKITGIKLRRTGHDQGYDERWPRLETVAELERGDVVVFNTIEDGDDYSDHTGIYMGDGKFIHASSGAGKVIVSDLSSGYYNRKFSWGLRIIK